VKGARKEVLCDLIDNIEALLPLNASALACLYLLNTVIDLSYE
jgi:hypothetical protein